MKAIKKTLLALALSGSCVAAYAGPFYVDLTGAANGGGDLGVGGTITGVKDEATFQYDSETIIDLGGNGQVDVGDTITTTGGLNVGGTFDIGKFGSNHVTGFDPGTDSLGFTNDSNLIESVSGMWGLSFTMELAGTIATMAGNEVTSVAYTGGLIEIYLMRDDGSGNLEAVNAFDLTVTGSDPSNPDNFLIFGEISYDGNEDPALVDLFHWAGGATCGGDDGFSAIANCDPPMVFTFRIDQNLNNVEPTLGPGNDQATISGDHEGSITFNVPEPATLFLLGGSLIGLGLSRRRLGGKQA